MGINSTSQNGATTFVRYTSFLGMLYVSNEENEAHIKAAKIHAGGEAEVKKGYQGYKGDTPSAKALAFLRDKGLSACEVYGPGKGSNLGRHCPGLPFVSCSRRESEFLGHRWGAKGAKFRANTILMGELLSPDDYVYTRCVHQARNEG